MAALFAIALVVPASPAGADDPPSEPIVIFDGGGYGHSIGMSQYGARAQALAGWTAEEITGFYYPGTEVADAAELPIPEEEFEQPIWVGLEQYQTSATLSWPDPSGSVCIDPDPSNETEPCLRKINVGAGEQIRFDWDETEDLCTLTRIQDGGETQLWRTAPECRVSATSNVGGAIWYGTYGHAGDSVELRRVPDAESFHVVAVIDLETYVAALDEMPSPWPQEAQKAQMLAGRTYALNRYLAHEKPELRAPGDAGLVANEDRTGQKDKCWCHVYNTTASQAYEGVAAATPERIAAAAATSGRVIAFFGAGPTWSNVIEAIYGSSNAGRTMKSSDSFNNDYDYPYLIAIDDPWSIDPTAENPYATWTLERTAQSIADNLGWDELRNVELIGTDPAVVRFEGIDDGQVVVEERKGLELRNAANLLSPQVSAIRIEGVATCNGYFVTMSGTSQADRLIGTPGHDVILGNGGDDTIKGRGGHDVICGGGGNDFIEGNHGDDRIYAGSGDDTVSGGGGLDVVLAGGGADTIDGGNGADELEGNAGNDTINGGSGADLVHGGPGIDVIDGQGGTDELFGDAGNDQLIGGLHSDTLHGGPGGDSLDGSDGYGDECIGGGGTATATEACEVVSSVP